ncbi:MAG: hypothetical protein Q7J65_01750 [Candidatus Marinimicrobia bacterium]|nr:hypothetical protein [Candidatus Neomarinimicrobiota bacterium]
MIYNPDVLTDLQDWLKSEGNNIVYLYGELDPITATAIDLSGSATNALKLIPSGEDHYIGIEKFDEAGQVYNALSNWMGFEVQPLSKPARLTERNGGQAGTENIARPKFKLSE